MHKYYQHSEEGAHCSDPPLHQGILGGLKRGSSSRASATTGPRCTLQRRPWQALPDFRSVLFPSTRRHEALVCMREGQVLLDCYHSRNRDNTVSATWPLTASQGMTPLNTLCLLGGHAAVFTAASPWEADLSPFHCLVSHSVPISELSETHPNNGQND